MTFTALAMSRSCEKENLEEVNSIETLNGTWSLISITGGQESADYQFEEGIIIWNFNNEANTINITNNYNMDDVYSSFQTGVYNFSTVSFDAITLLDIANESFGSYYILDDTLTIDKSNSTSDNSDGYVLHFNRL